MYFYLKAMPMQTPTFMPFWELWQVMSRLKSELFGKLHSNLHLGSITLQLTADS
jgi:hypothetical protein